MGTYYNTALPEGEIYEYEDCFGGDPFGTHGKQKSYFGQSGEFTSDINPTVVCLRLTGALHEMNSAMMNSFVQSFMGGDRVLMFSRHPFAKPGDDNISESYYFDGKSVDRHLECYTSEDGADLAPPRDPETNLPTDRPADWFIPAGHDRFLTLRRLKIQADETHPPIFIEIAVTKGDGQIIEPYPPEQGEQMYHPVTGAMGIWTQY